MLILLSFCFYLLISRSWHTFKLYQVHLYNPDQWLSVHLYQRESIKLQNEVSYYFDFKHSWTIVLNSFMNRTRKFSCFTVPTKCHDAAWGRALPPATPTSSSNDSASTHGCTLFNALQPAAIFFTSATATSDAQPTWDEFRWKQWTSHATW